MILYVRILLLFKDECISFHVYDILIIMNNWAISILCLPTEKCYPFSSLSAFPSYSPI